MHYESDPDGYDAIDDEPDDGPDGEEIVQCWCGATGTADELFDDAVYDECCGGTRHLECHCGGDLCACHHHGQEIECPGCEDCGHGDDDDYRDDYYPDDDEGE